MGDRPAYVLSVEPISPSKFLYKGKIWVDAAAFAVAKMEVQPAKNPSFWISRTLIHHTNEMTMVSGYRSRIGVKQRSASVELQPCPSTISPIESQRNLISTTPPAAGTR